MRVTRIVDLPAIDAAWLRARTWWDGLSPRERVLVGTLGALLAVAVLVWGIIKPLQAARADALADIRTYETLNARIRAAGTLGAPAGPPPRTGAPADMLRQSAGGFGLQPQVEAVPTGVRATIPDGDYAAVVNWMADVARTTPLAATRIDLRRTGVTGRVFAQVEYRS
ncbi:general secretion pathway protein M [Sphingomonas guangdongensis]|uniref:General secretion pathway protein M n=1 Tax=Sphingomonas guangdongensis TaxID=1141890 RepID=A0A285QYE8_9SPHN|nr:type II secretion system protein M [Sphingomonas guangdongensis]SOB86574.1 general secretion pathway protein M [Sphingomonas guangdongensis]